MALSDKLTMSVKSICLLIIRHFEGKELLLIYRLLLFFGYESDKFNYHHIDLMVFRFLNPLFVLDIRNKRTIVLRWRLNSIGGDG
jgi:hypothetical protein